MKATTVIRALGPIDLKNVWRDSLLRWMLVMPFGFGLMFLWLVPVAQARLVEDFDITLVPYYPLLASFLLLTMPTISGVVIGFLLLDQRDDQTLAALQVTPLTATGYLTYRLAIPTLLSILTTLAVMPWIGLVQMSLAELTLAALTVAPLAPLFALFLVGFAANKVQGFALMKAAGVLNWPPIIAYFIDSNWQLACGIVPTYWPAKVFWMLARDETGVWPFVGAALLYQAALLWWLVRRFERVLGGR